MWKPWFTDYLREVRKIHRKRVRRNFVTISKIFFKELEFNHIIFGLKLFELVVCLSDHYHLIWRENDKPQLFLYK